MGRNRIVAIWILLILAAFGLMYILIVPKKLESHEFLDFHGNKDWAKSYKEEKCQKLQKLKLILLAVNYNFPHYSSIPILKEMYGGIFGKVVFCGNGDHLEVIKVRGNKGYLGYDCVSNAIKMFPNFIGYLQSNDDVILNWWNLMKLDSSKIWISTPIPYKDKIGNYIGIGNGAPSDGWHWWNAEDIPRRCDATFHQLSSLNNTKDGLNVSKYLVGMYQNTYDF